MEFDPVGLVDHFAGLPVVDGEPFGAFEGVAVARTLHGLCQRGGVGFGAETDFGFIVAVEIADDERSPPHAHVDVPAEVVAPEEFPRFSVVGVELIRALADADAAGVFAAAGPFDDEVVNAIAVEIAESGHGNTGDIVAELDGAVILNRRVRGVGDTDGLVDLAAGDDGTHGPRVLAVEWGRGVDVVGGAGERLGVELRGGGAGGGTINVERDVRRIRF